MQDNQIKQYNAALKNAPASDIVQWAIAQANGGAIVSTNFRPFEAVILHLCVQVQPDIPVLWVDHGYNRPATYQFAEKLREKLRLNLKIYTPKITAAHRDAIYGPVPGIEDEIALQNFSAMMKLEPFQRGIKELTPSVWITALRKVQNPNRAELAIINKDDKLNVIKVSPVFYWTDAHMEAYLKRHNLPNEWDYFDPAKGDEKRECGLHTKLS